MFKRQAKKGFTLVEILIVVVILGILAAIVIPQFTSASEAAKASSMVTQLQTLRSQFELYQVQHNGNYPTLAQMDGTDEEFSVMVNSTDVNGATTGTDYGPYLQKAPVNSFSDGNEVEADNTADWQYTAADGSILAVVSAAVFADRVELGIDGEAVVSE